MNVVIVGASDENRTALKKALEAKGDGTVVVTSSLYPPMPEGLMLPYYRNPPTAYPPSKSRPRQKNVVMKKCGLPRCNAVSSRDYCSAAHCFEHRGK